MWPASRLAQRLEAFRIPTATINDKLPHHRGVGSHKALPDIRLRALDKSIVAQRMTLSELKANTQHREDHKLPLDFQFSAPVGALIVNVCFVSSLLFIRP